MKIKILGTRGEIEPSAPYHSKQSGVLVDNEILLDIGEEIFLRQHPKAILLTHLHPDHAFFVRHPNKKIQAFVPPLYGPEAYRKNAVVKKLISPKLIEKHTIIPIPTHHSAKVASQAYLIKKGKEKILYTGDMIWINKEYHSQFANLDLIITEASFFRKGGRVNRNRITGKIYGHTGIPNLLALFSKFTKTILFVHFGGWFYEDINTAKKKLINLGKQYQVNVLVGYDGMEIDLSERRRR
jgi:ribonuclease BN (tRNA processing enzyme)